MANLHNNLKLKLRLDEGELIDFCNKVDMLEIEKFKGKYTIQINGILKKSSASFGVISKHLDMFINLLGLKEQ